MWGRMWGMHQQVKDTLSLFSRPVLVKENEKVTDIKSEEKKPPGVPKLKTGQKIGLALGPLLFFAIMYFFPAEGLSKEGLGVLATTVWIATWWITEALPIPVTSLLPILLFPILGVVEAKEVTTPYADSIIFLFIGGFTLAIAIEKWNLHRRIAMGIISIMGIRTERLVLGFILATGFLSMWISNTATAMMMVPIALAIVTQAKESIHQEDKSQIENFVKATLFGVMYAASLGGLGTLVGTPANIILANTINKMYNIELDFFTWMTFATPLVLILLTVSWLYLVKVAFPQKLKTLPGSKEMMEKERKLLGKISYEEKVILSVFIFTALCWMSRSFLLVKWMPYLDDTMIAIFAAVLLFLLPAKNGDSPRILAWKDAEKIPWGILLLFGGGSALGTAFQTSGLAQWIGEQMTFLEGLHFALVIIAVVLLVILLSEFTSNITTSIMLLPIMGSLALALDVHPYMLLFAASVATSCAFMLPTAATPNTIMFATGQLPVKVMIRTGFLMNLFCLGIITLMIMYFMPAIWGIDLKIFPENMK